MTWPDSAQGFAGQTRSIMLTWAAPGGVRLRTESGPDGGDEGGLVVAIGTPNQIAANAKSHTGRYLKEYLPKPQAVINRAKSEQVSL